MHLIVYSSESTLADTDVESALNDIAATARRHNGANGITGVLFYENRHFLQAIEGDEPALRDTYGRILQDGRHTNVHKLVDEPAESRAFPDWAMDTFFVDSPGLVDSKTVKLLHELYDHHFETNARDFIEFVKKMIDELDTFRILSAER